MLVQEGVCGKGMGEGSQLFHSKDLHGAEAVSDH